MLQVLCLHIMALEDGLSLLLAEIISLLFHRPPNNYNKNHKNLHYFFLPPPNSLTAWFSPTFPAFFILNFLSSSSLSSLFKGLSMSKKVLYLTAVSVGNIFLQPPDLHNVNFTSFILLTTLSRQVFQVYYSHFSFIWRSSYSDWVYRSYQLQTVDQEVRLPS